VWYVIGVATLRALVRAGNKTSRDARSWYMISGDAKSWVWFTYIHCHIAQLSNGVLLTTADGGQSSRVPVPLLDDLYVAVRQARLVDTKSKPEEAPSEAEELQLLGSRIPLMGEEFVVVEPSSTRTDLSHSSASSDCTAPLSPDHPLTHVSPTPTHTRASFHHRNACMTVHAQLVMSYGHSARVTEAMDLSDSAFYNMYRSSYETPSSSSPALPVWKRYRGTSELILDTNNNEGTDEDGEDESLDTNDEIEGLDDEDRGLDDKGRSLDEEGLGLEGSKDEVILEGQQWAAPVVETAVGEPLGLAYRALRHQELAIEEDQVYNTFEVGQGSGSVPEPERLVRVSALRQPTLTTWIDLEDDIAYIDVPAYLPPAPPAQTPPSPEWSSGSLPISPVPSAVPSPIPSPMISLTILSPIASPVATLTATISIDEG
ncbi:hypothetical protein Tco_1069006, partial [Tanacetum coccineum]